jgi:hypothetical protein
LTCGRSPASLDIRHRLEHMGGGQPVSAPTPR